MIGLYAWPGGAMPFLRGLGRGILVWVVPGVDNAAGGVVFRCSLTIVADNGLKLWPTSKSLVLTLMFHLGRLSNALADRILDALGRLDDAGVGVWYTEYIL